MQSFFVPTYLTQFLLQLFVGEPAVLLRTSPAMSESPAYYLSPAALLADVSGSEDEALNFTECSKQKKGKHKHSRPVGISSLQMWGLLKFPDGKHKGSTFVDAFLCDQEYCAWIMARSKFTSSWAASFKHYIMAMENATSRAHGEKTGITCKKSDLGCLSAIPVSNSEPLEDA